MEPDPLAKDDMPSEIRMQSTTEQRSRIPLDVKFENLLALSGRVNMSTIIASTNSHESSDEVTALALSGSLDLLRMWPPNLKIIIPEADPFDSLRMIGRLDGPLATTLLNVLGEIEKYLRELRTGTTGYQLGSSEKFRATCGRIKTSVDRLFELQTLLAEEITTRKDEVRKILSEAIDPAKLRLPLVCFDGGGVCSYSGLLICEALMDEVRSVLRESEGNAIAESIRPHDVFRYMFGASIGGWIAIMLGRLKMTDKQCKDTFRTYTKSIFERSRKVYYVFRGLTKSTTKYSGEGLTRATKEVIISFEPSPEFLPWRRRNMFAAAPEYCRCRVGVVAYVEPDYTADFTTPHIFRTYKNTSPGARNSGEADRCDIQDVALAATATPMYFPAAKIDGKEYSDGGFGANDPSYEAYRELKKLHPGNPICLVSIGPGTDTDKIRFRSFEGTGNIHRRMSLMLYGSEKASYFRFNVPSLEHVPFDEWTVKSRKEWPEAGKMDTLEFIERQTSQYLAEDETRTAIRACAQMVVDSCCPIYEPMDLSFLTSF